MIFSRIAAVASKEWREIVRDRLFFVLAFVVPAALTVLFGYGLSLDVENIPMAIVDHDRTALSREYANRFIGSRYFKFEGYADNEGQLTPALTDSLVDAGRVVTGLVERGVTRLAAGRKLAGTVALLPLAEIGIPVLAEFAAPKRWSF